MGLYLGGDEVSQKISNVTIGLTLPDQTDNAGKFLTTDGENVSWKEVEINEDKFVHATGDENIGGLKKFDTSPFVPTPSVGTKNLKVANTEFVSKSLEGKQDTLVSGTNIKTINGESIVGSGDLEIVPTITYWE